MVWSKELYNIALEHSKNMAEGLVAFGHDGFYMRKEKVSIFVRMFSENVAYNYGCGDPVEVAVKGWINSPENGKIMLAAHNLCGIGVYCKGGKYYFTQLLALQ